LNDNKLFGLIYDNSEQQLNSLISNWKVQKCVLFKRIQYEKRKSKGFVEDMKEGEVD
jgi:hypothetical protein